MASAQIRSIETPNATLQLSEQTGDLIGLRWKNPNLEVIGEPRLGENFRLLVPKVGYEAAYFNSRDQHVSQIQVTPDGVVCTYDSLRNEQESIPVKVLYQIRAVNQQILFSIEVDNPTDRKLAEVMYGIIGGQEGIDNRFDTESIVPGENRNLAPKFFSQFQGGGYGGGNLGIRYDATGFAYPGNMTMGWMDVFNPKAGVGYYYANQDPEIRLSALYFELRPFTKSASVKDTWPLRSDLPAGEPVGLTMGWVDFPYAGKGTFKAGPVALQVHAGDWHTASGIYRGWFDQHFTITRSRSWLRRENAWQSIILANGEDAIVHRFDELPTLAADAKKYGITTFEIDGWNIGGIDRGYPQYQPDPRLGSTAEFRKALADVRALGVHPLIFSNIQVADTATPLFQSTLEQYTVDGRWAPDWQLWGWGEGTIGARLGFARSNMAVMSPAHPQFRKFLMDQYLQLVRDGADGLQLDKTGILWSLDFNPQLPVSPDKSLPQGVLETLAELLPKARSIDPDFALASEITFDRALPYVDVSYTRMGDIDMDTALRYTFPEWTGTIFGESPGDFNPMNNGMRYGMVWALAPRHYNDSVDEILTRPLARYVSELIRIRKKYEDLLFYGRFNDTMGVTVRGDADIRYSVFKSAQPSNPSTACVVINFGDVAESAEVNNIEGISGGIVITSPFNPDRDAHLPVRLSIPPHQLAVVVKQ